MLKNFLKKISPSAEALKKHKYLRIFGNVIHNYYLWHVNRHGIARAVAIGLFCAFIPLPTQMFMAAVLAIIWRAYLPLSVGLVWLTNPVTIPPILYVCYKFGAWLMKAPPYSFNFSANLAWLSSQVQQIWKPLLVGCLSFAVFFAVLGYFTTYLVWRYWIKRRWQKRSKAQRLKKM